MFIVAAVWAVTALVDVDASAGERWFWAIVALIGTICGLGELRDARRDPDDWEEYIAERLSRRQANRVEFYLMLTLTLAVSFCLYWGLAVLLKDYVWWPLTIGAAVAAVAGLCTLAMRAWSRRGEPAGMQ